MSVMWCYTFNLLLCTLRMFNYRSDGEIALMFTLATVIENARLEMEDYGVDNLTTFIRKNRVLNCYSASYMKRGTSRLRIYDRDYYAKPGDLLIIPPNVVHDHIKDDNEETCFMWWDFNYKLYDTIDVMSLQNFPILFHVPNSCVFEQAFNRYLESLDKSEKVSDFIFREARALELVAILFDMIIDSGDGSFLNISHGAGVFLSIISDVVQNMTEKGILDMLSRKYGMHPNYISNRFKKLYGVTPVQFQRRIRLKKAQEMLIGDTASTVSEIAYNLGYECVADFTRFFKAQSGMAPLHYRNTNMKK